MEIFHRQLEITDKGSVDKTGNMLVFILVSPFREQENKSIIMFNSEPKILTETFKKIYCYIKILFHVLISLNWVGLRMNSIFGRKTVVATTGVNTI